MVAIYVRRIKANEMAIEEVPAYWNLKVKEELEK